jgi:hypothetical protein
MGAVIAIELSIQGTFRGPMETPADLIEPTGAKVNIPCVACPRCGELEPGLHNGELQPTDD